MGRNRKNRNGKYRRRSQTARYAKSWRNKDINTTLNADEFREKQSKYHKDFAKKQQDILSRSIFVTWVQDLKDERNLIALERFFAAQYGPVYQCVRTEFPNNMRSHGNRRSNFPPARIVFIQKSSAEKVFGGKELFKVQNNMELECPVGHKNGKIMVRPCMPSSDLLIDETRGFTIKLAVSGLFLGHWCPAELEMENLDDTTTESDVWLGIAEGPTPQLTIDIKERSIEIEHLSMMQTDRISFRFKQLLMPMKLCRDENGKFSIIFSLKHAPRVHRMDDFILFSDLTVNAEYERCLRWGKIPVEVLGSCLGYKLEISDCQIRSLLCHEKCNQLREFGLLGFDIDAIQNPNIIQSKYVGSEYDGRFDEALKKVKDFKLACLLSVLRDSGRFTSFHAITDKVSFSGKGDLNVLEAVSTIHQPSQIKEIAKVLEKISAGFGYTKTPCRLLSNLLKGPTLSEDHNLPPHFVLVPRMRVSPLRTVCGGFEVETSNRALRFFTSMPCFEVDMFMRVTIIDDDGGQLGNSELTAEVEPRIRGALLNGITLCGRTYEFLAYSSSQLKECSAWMVCCQATGWNIVSMREQLGDFSKCKTASKLGARLGQCFSTTFTNAGRQGHDTNKIVRTQVVVPDIKGSKGCHSDGTGIIRRDVLNTMLLQLPFGSRDSRDISIIQIRYGGAKGTLTAFDEPALYLPHETPPADVYLRPSMVKFDAPYSDLEVCSVGRNVSYFLNRNVILLLNTAHGVPENTFIDLQNEMLDDLDGMLLKPEIARRMVPSLAGPENEQRDMILHMLYAGLTPLDEPFLYDCLTAVRSHHLFSLRKKSRIRVDKGSVLVGGIDETGYLPEGCVFFQVGDEPYVGHVLVTKHPVMHPGDVRMLNAIDVPDLRNHRNMIFFSRHGERPEANKMSGSDLDGDEFAVCWDERLFIGRNAEAMDYTGPDENTSNPVPIQREDISGALVRHFLDHIKNASLGQIAMLWLDHAAINGANCLECIKLAELHSVAVDYPKSGVPAIIPKNLRLHKDTPRPHWREKKNSPDYHCKSVIGKLYDEVIHREKLVKAQNRSSRALAGRKVDKYGTITCEVSGKMPRVHDERIPMGLLTMPNVKNPVLLSSDFQTLANEERELYNTELLQTMNKYRLRSEGETYTGCIRKFHKLHKKRQHDFTQEVRRQYGEIRRKFRRSFFEHVIRISEQLEDPSVGINGIIDLLSEMQFEDANDDGDSTQGVGDSIAPDVALMNKEEDSESEASIDDDRIRAVEAVVTKEIIDPIYGSKDDLILQRVAFALAAAYYNATYHPDHRWTDRDNNVTLFGFPWIVADVIGLACGPYLRPGP